MARHRIPPTYRFHAKTGKAIVTYYCADGARRSVLLPGEYNSAPSRREYKRILAILNAGGEPQAQKQPAAAAPSLSIAELIARCWEHVKQYYRRARRIGNAGSGVHDVLSPSAELSVR